MFHNSNVKTVILFTALTTGSLALSACQNAAHMDEVRSEFSVEHVTGGGDDFIKITLPAERPQNMAVVTPSREFYVVHAPDDGKVLFEMVNKEGQRLDLEIVTSEFLGSLFETEDKTVAPIFTSPGTYTLYLAENLETEPENSYSFSKDFVFKP